MRHSPSTPIGLCFLLASQCILVVSLSRLVRTPHQEELVATPGDAVTLECEIRNDSSGDGIRWLLNGELLSLPEEEEEEKEVEVEGVDGRRRPFFNATHGVHVLRISHVLIQDDGVWHCQGVLGEREALTFTSRPIRLIVAIAPEKPFIVFEDRRLADGATFTIREKNTVTFTCVVRAANPAPSRVEWLLGDGDNLTSSSHLAEEYSQTERLYHSKSDVTFEVTRKHHRVPLHCHVHHLAHVNSVTATVSFNILYSPSFVISRTPGFGYPIREGISVSLRCEVDANPSSKPHWVKDEGSPPTIIDSIDGFLNFSSIARDNAGWYRCSTQHEFGHFASFGYFLNVRYACKTTPTDESAQLPCPVQYTPEIVDQRTLPTPPPQIEVGVGGAVMLECAAEGRPPPSYCWARVKEDGRLESMATENKLSFDRILYTDAGVYKCIARGGDGGERVDSSPPSRDVEVVVTGKPHVEPVNRTLRAIVGKSVSVAVQYCANPNPSRTNWIVHSFVLKPGEINDRFVAHNVTSLHGSHCFLAVLDVLQVQQDDAGEFLFFVKNSHGIEDGVVWLNVTQASSFSVSRGRKSIFVDARGILPLLFLLLLAIER